MALSIKSNRRPENDGKMKDGDRGEGVEVQAELGTPLTVKLVLCLTDRLYSQIREEQKEQRHLQTGEKNYTNYDFTPTVSVRLAQEPIGPSFNPSLCVIMASRHESIKVCFGPVLLMGDEFTEQSPLLFIYYGASVNNSQLG